MIKVYPSRLEGEPLEVHETAAACTMRQWLTEHAPRLDLADPPITIHINGVVAGLDDVFTPVCVVDVHIEPRGFFVAVLVGALVAVSAMMLLTPKPQSSENRQGRGLSAVSASANTARPGEPIPDIAGRPPRVYPDYLVPPRYYYEAPTEQWVELFLCLGKGEYQKDIADVYVGNTRITSLGEDADVRFFEPGAYLPGHGAGQWWHSPTEVGFTSRGSSGMELGTVSGRTQAVNATAFSVGGEIISVEVGDDFPSDWFEGVELRIEVPYPATITAGGVRDEISSEFAFSHFTPTVGMQVELAGDTDGVYVVHSYTPPSSGTPEVPGSPSSYEASAAPARLDFGDTPAGLTIAAPSGTYSVFLSANFLDADELLAAINGQLNATGIMADYVSGHLRVIERESPYSGQPVSASGAAHDDLFGASPSSTVGIKTEAAKPAGVAKLTLTTLDDLPVSGLPMGDVQLAVAPAGMLYEVVDRVSDRALDVRPKVGVSQGWAPLTSGSIFVTLGPDSQEVGWTGPFAVTPPGELCEMFEIDTVYPQGLIRYNEKGKQRSITVWTEVQWRENGGPWQSEFFSRTAMTPDALGYTDRVYTRETASVEVRMRRGSRDPRGGGTNNEAVQWTGLRGRIVGEPERYQGVTTMSVKLRTGDRLSAQSDNQIWCKVTRILPLVEGGTGPTRDLAPYLLHILESVGYGRDRVDMPTVEALHDVWKERQDRFDYAVTKSTTVKQLANHVLRCGFAELTVDRGLIKPVRDARRDTPQYIYSPQEFVDYPTLTTRLPAFDEVDGVDAEFVDAATGRTETIKYRLPFDEGRRAEKITLIGVTNYQRAYRLAARHRRTQAYRRTSFQGETELHALNSSYMSFDRIQDGIPGYGQSAFVVDVAGDVLTLSEPVDWGADAGRPDAGRVIAFRQMDGRVTEPVWVKQGPRPDQVILQSDPGIAYHLGGDGRDPTMVYIGTMRTLAHDVLVTRIEPRSNGRVTIEAVEYDQRVYLDDDWLDTRRQVLLTSMPYVTENRTSNVYETLDLTSLLYQIEQSESIASMGVHALQGEHRKMLIQQTLPSEFISGASVAVDGGVHRDLVLRETMPPELISGATVLVEGGSHRDIVKRQTLPHESMLHASVGVDGGAHKTHVRYENGIPEFISGNQVKIEGGSHEQFD